MGINEGTGQQAGLPVILLVEDNPDDVLLTRRAINKAGLQVTLSVVTHGEEALDYLERAGAPGASRTTPLPGLILLDLKLPRLSGLEVLQWIRERHSLSAVPVVVLTSSTEEEDISRAYRLGANSYLQKPVAFDELVKLLGILNLYWFNTNLTAPVGVRN